MPPSGFLDRKPSMGLFSPRGWSSYEIKITVISTSYPRQVYSYDIKYIKPTYITLSLSDSINGIEILDKSKI